MGAAPHLLQAPRPVTFIALVEMGGSCGFLGFLKIFIIKNKPSEKNSLNSTSRHFPAWFSKHGNVKENLIHMFG